MSRAWNGTAGPPPRQPGSREQSSHGGKPGPALDPPSDRTGLPSDPPTDRTSRTSGPASDSRPGSAPRCSPPPCTGRDSSTTHPTVEPLHALGLPGATPRRAAAKSPIPERAGGPGQVMLRPSLDEAVTGGPVNRWEQNRRVPGREDCHRYDYPGRGCEPGRFQMVRRRSTVRFRKGAPQTAGQAVGLLDSGHHQDHLTVI
jgi:hypothetical protein